MKLALLGDIHGNHLALAAVLDAAQNAGVDRLLITGDIVGYYFWPVEVVELLEPWDKIVVRGNHEDMLARSLDSSEYLEKVDRRYGTGLRVALDLLSPDQLDWLAHLPHPSELEIDGVKIMLCHGSPWDVDQYVYPDADQELLVNCSASGHDWVILGHTHYPMEHRLGKTTIVNPGSVGQPRNRIPGAHWALLDTESGALSFRVETYDYSVIIETAAARQANIPYLHQVFTRR